MSIKVYSLLSGETEKLKDKDIEISVNDENNIDIIRGGDPKDYPKFSCLYNKEEIDIKLVSDYLDKNGLESFGALNIMGGKGIYTWNTDGTLTTKIQYCASLNKLYERLRDSAKNLEVFLTKMREDVDSGIAPGATLKYFTGEISDKDIIEEEYDVSTYKKLIEALTANQKGMLDVMNLMIQNIDEVNNAIVPSIDWNTLKDLKIIVEHVDETTKAITYGTDTIKPKNMETIIKELSTSNDNISKWIKIILLIY